MPAMIALCRVIIERAVTRYVCETLLERAELRYAGYVVDYTIR